MPKDRSTADFDHRFGANRGFFADSRTESPGKDDSLHRKSFGNIGEPGVLSMAGNLTRASSVYVLISIGPGNYGTLMGRLMADPLCHTGFAHTCGNNLRALTGNVPAWVSKEPGVVLEAVSRSRTHPAMVG